MTIDDILRHDLLGESGWERWLAIYGHRPPKTTVALGDVARACGARHTWLCLRACDLRVLRHALDVVLARAVNRARAAAAESRKEEVVSAAEAAAHAAADASVASVSSVLAAASAARWAASASAAAAETAAHAAADASAASVSAAWASYWAEAACQAAFDREMAQQVSDLMEAFPPILEVRHD